MLITRPADTALALRQELEAKGYSTLIEPLLTIEQLKSISVPPDRVQALALTSANAVPALGDAAKRLPVYTVGKATAEAARSAGCGHVIAADGDGADLAALIGARCRPEDGPILHVSGEAIRADLQRILADRMFEVHREVVYRARPSTGFSRGLLTAWRRRRVAAVLLFSPRTSEVLVRLLIDHGLTCHVDSTSAICLSESTATPCRALAWKDVCLAARPNQDALVRALEGSIRIC